MNILLLVPSLYREDGSNQEFPLFYSTGERVTVRHTNLPVFYSISKHLNAIGEKIDVVLLLCSTEVREKRKTTDIDTDAITTLEYITRCFSSYQQSLDQTPANFISINLPSGELRNTNSIQHRLDESLRDIVIDNNTRIWVDFTSGLRSHAILLIFLLRFFEMSNRGQVAEILYANLTPGNASNKIESCLAVYRLFGHYRLLDQIGFVPPAALEEAGNESNRQREINQAINELNMIYHALKLDLLNTSGNTTKIFTEAIVKANQYTSQYPDAPTIHELSRRINDVFNRKDDLLASTEYLLQIDMPSLAMIKLRENAFRYLIERKVIQTELSASAIENELLSANHYYSSFIRYIRNCLQTLQHDFETNPRNAVILDLDRVLNDRYNRNDFEYVNKNIVPMNIDSQSHFIAACPATVNKLRLDFAREIHALASNTPIPEETRTANDYNRIKENYSKKEIHYQHLYQMSGFPFPCFDQKGSICYPFYKRYLTHAAEELILLLECKKSNSVIPDHFDFIIPQALEYDVENLSYRQLVYECYSRLPEMIPLKFSHQSDRAYEHGWSSGQITDIALQEFLYEYLPIHQLVRKSRNSFAHPDETWFVSPKESIDVELSDNQKRLLDKINKGKIRISTIVPKDREVIEKYIKHEELKLLWDKLVRNEIEVKELQQQQRKELLDLLDNAKDDTEELTPDEKGLIIKICLHMLRNVASEERE